MTRDPRSETCPACGEPASKLYVVTETRVLCRTCLHDDMDATREVLRELLEEESGGTTDG
jgi:transposase